MRPTELCFVPRIWDMVSQSSTARSTSPLLGGRRRSSGAGSAGGAPSCGRTCSADGLSWRRPPAPISAEMTACGLSPLLGRRHLVEGYWLHRGRDILTTAWCGARGIDYKLVDARAYFWH